MGITSTRQKLLVTVATGSIIATLQISAAAELSSLEQKLESKYAVTTMVGRAEIGATGAALILKKPVVVAVPTASLVTFHNYYKDGRLSHSNVLVPPLHMTFKPGDVVYLTKARAHTKLNTVTFDVISAQEYEQIRYKAAVDFQFPKGIVAGGDFNVIDGAVSEVFEIDKGAQPSPARIASPQTAASPAPAQPAKEVPMAEPPPPPPPPEPPVTKTIELGQTTQQVIEVLGQPVKIVKLGAKEIYVFKDLKVTFSNGKVSDVE